MREQRCSGRRHTPNGAPPRVATFAGLDDEVRELTSEAVRGGEGRPRIDVPDALRERIGQRDAARLAFDAATAAIEVFAREAGVARAAASEAGLAVSNIVDQLVDRAA